MLVDFDCSAVDFVGQVSEIGFGIHHGCSRMMIVTGIRHLKLIIKS